MVKNEVTNVHMPYIGQVMAVLQIKHQPYDKLGCLLSTAEYIIVFMSMKIEMCRNVRAEAQYTLQRQNIKGYGKKNPSRPSANGDFHGMLY